jgi:hypothetical protein
MKMGNVYFILIREHNEKTKLWITKCALEDNINMNYNKQGAIVWIGLIWMRIVSSDWL